MADTKQTETSSDLPDDQQFTAPAVTDEPGRRADARRSRVDDALRSAGTTGSGAVHATQNVLHQAVAATEQVGTGMVGGATHLAQGVVHGVRDVGTDAATIVVAGANGAINVIGSVGSHALHTAAGLLVDVVDGVRQIAGAALRRGDVPAQRRQAPGRDADQGADQGANAARGRRETDLAGSAYPPPQGNTDNAPTHH